MSVCNCQTIINMILCFRSKIQQGVNRKRNVKTKNEKEILTSTSTLREDESYELGDLMCFVKLNVRTLIMKRKHLNAAMRCESAYTVSKN